MALPKILENRLSLPVIGSPMFIVSGVELVLAQCKAGIVGSFPSLNARGDGQFEQWLITLNNELEQYNQANPDKPAAPYAVNLIVHKTNTRLEEDLALCVKYEVPLIITSLGAREDVNQAIHSYGGIVLHDIINNMFAHKAIEKGADGLIAVAHGAGGHAGNKSPFALIQEIREWFDGPLLLSGCLSTGDAILAAQAMGADLGYMGSAFIATKEANAITDYKEMIVKSNSDDIMYTNYFTGVNGNYLIPSIVRSGLDPNNLPEKANNMTFTDTKSEQAAKAWRDIWGCGQGIGAVDAVDTVAERVEKLIRQYNAAKARLAIN